MSSIYRVKWWQNVSLTMQETNRCYQNITYVSLQLHIRRVVVDSLKRDTETLNIILAVE